MDTKLYPWARKAKSWFQQRYGARLVLVEGDSSKTVPAFFAANPSTRCDLAVVDGAHDYVHPLLDIVALVQASRCNASVVADDLCDPDACAAHRLTDHTNHPSVIGPSQAWHEAHALGYIAEYEQRFSAAPDRGWAAARVLCVRGRPRPPHRAYSTEPRTITFVPNRQRHDKPEVRLDEQQRLAARTLWGRPQQVD